MKQRPVPSCLARQQICQAGSQPASLPSCLASSACPPRRLTSGVPCPPPSFPQVLQLAVAGCRAVGEFMRQRLLEHTDVSRGQLVPF